MPCSRLTASHLAIVLTLVAAVLLAETIGLRANTLEANGRWRSAKHDLALPVMGAVGFERTPIALHRNRLDLGAWHGFQQVEWWETIEPERIALQFRLDEGAHLSVLYGPDGASGARGWAGFRFSRHPDLVTRELFATPAGAVLKASPLERPIEAGWHEVTFDFGDPLRVTLDGEMLPVTVQPAAGPMRLALRGSARATLVDDVRIVLRDGRTLRETFRASGAFARAAACALALLAAIELTARLGARADLRRRRGLRVALAFGCASVALIGWLAQTTVLGGRYPTDLVAADAPDLANTIETPGEVIARLRRARDPRPAIVALGGSQTWGAGVRRIEDRWTDRLEEALGGAYRVWNTGISGQGAQPQVKQLHDHWLAWEPLLVIAVVGLNDGDADAFTAALEVLVSLCRERDIALLFVQEPMAWDAPPLSFLAANREAMRRVAEAHDVPLLDMHVALAESRDRALMWWDFAHLSSSGHALFANALLPSVERVLARDSAPPGP